MSRRSSIGGASGCRRLYFCIIRISRRLKAATGRFPVQNLFLFQKKKNVYEKEKRESPGVGTIIVEGSEIMEEGAYRKIVEQDRNDKVQSDNKSYNLPAIPDKRYREIELFEVNRENRKDKNIMSSLRYERLMPSSDYI